MTFHARFFGKFKLDYGGTVLTGVRSQKSLELLAYLLLKRSAHSREALANLIWGDIASTEQCKKYLRNTLWQLQKKLSNQFSPNGHVLRVDARSIAIDPSYPVWTDVEEFESKYEQVRDHDGTGLSEAQAQDLRRAVDLYTGPFLEGWFNEWCLVHRERTQHLVLLMLDKLMDYAIVKGEFESGILHGERILAYDRAREVTHRNLMKLFYFAGDRTSALRQYKLCATILMDELEIEPSERTRHVLEAIRSDTLSLGDSLE
jgi:DNA-binding SARP family transcriptional activator